MAPRDNPNRLPRAVGLKNGAPRHSPSPSRRSGTTKTRPNHELSQSHAGSLTPFATPNTTGTKTHPTENTAQAAQGLWIQPSMNFFIRVDFS